MNWKYVIGWSMQMSAVGAVIAFTVYLNGWLVMLAMAAALAVLIGWFALSYYLLSSKG